MIPEVLMRTGIIKKITALALSCCLLLTACGGSDGASTETTIEGAVTVTDESGSTVTDENGSAVTSIEGEEPEEMELVVGFIYPDKVESNTVSVLFEAARMQIEKVLGAETYYIEDVLVSQFSEATDALVEKGCNVIVSCSNKFPNSISSEAKDAKDTRFISFGGAQSAHNLWAFQGELFQPAYVCGLAAAYNSTKGIIGVVADSSVVNCYGTINAFIQGAKELTGAKTDVRLNWSWGTNDETTKNAIDDLAAQGCDVIFACTYSAYAVKYCETLGIKVIGTAYDMPVLAPNNYLTGCFYNFNTYLVDVLRTIRYGTEAPVIYNEGLSAGAVRLVSFSENCADGTIDICDTLYQLCVDKKARIFVGEIRDNYGNIRVEKGAVLNHAEIWTLEWLDGCVNAISDFTVPVLEPAKSDLQIKE